MYILKLVLDSQKRSAWNHIKNIDALTSTIKDNNYTADKGPSQNHNYIVLDDIHKKRQSLLTRL